MLQEINKELLIYMSSLKEYNFIENTVSYFADIPIFFLPIFLVILWIFYSYNKKNKITEKENKKKLLFIFYSVVVGILLSSFIKLFVNIDRPEEAIVGAGKLILENIPNDSFPSDHATASLAFLTSLFLAGYKKIGLYFLPFVIIMLISRVIVGVHWPLDIIAGIFVGITSSFITFKYLQKCRGINIINKYIIKTMSFIKL